MLKTSEILSLLSNELENEVHYSEMIEKSKGNLVESRKYIGRLEKTQAAISILNEVLDDKYKDNECEVEKLRDDMYRLERETAKEIINSTRYETDEEIGLNLELVAQNQRYKTMYKTLNKVLDNKQNKKGVNK